MSYEIVTPEQNTELANLDSAEGLLGALGINPVEELGEVSESKWFPWIRLYDDAARDVKEELFPARHWGLGGLQRDKVIDLDRDFDAIPLYSLRKSSYIYDPRCDVYFSTKEGTDVPELYKEHVRTAESSKQSGCMYGTEFLVYIPDHDVFATYFANNPSHRSGINGTLTSHAWLGKIVRFSGKIAKTNDYSWWVPKFELSERQFQGTPIWVKKAQAALEKFKNFAVVGVFDRAKKKQEEAPEQEARSR